METEPPSDTAGTQSPATSTSVSVASGPAPSYVPWVEAASRATGLSRQTLHTGMTDLDARRPAMAVSDGPERVLAPGRAPARTSLAVPQLGVGVGDRRRPRAAEHPRPAPEPALRQQRLAGGCLAELEARIL